ncbi:MAG: hypothetical protein KAT00_04145, partial [Planctomycetes bacterium]|nr:hypothetical protein [Planctomycetota bacterium]
YNNLGFNNDLCDIVVGEDFAGENANTITRNNIADILSSDRGGYAALPGTVSNNWNGWLNGQATVKTQLRDPDNLDFRPKAGSDLIDAGYVISGITDGYLGSTPDIGPYEYGDTNYWIAGYKSEKASTPVPPDNAIAVKTDADLMWLEGYKATSHNVYLGTDPGSLVFQGNKTNNIYDPGVLTANTVYYWRIDAVTPAGTITGDVWSLDTGARPTLPLPAYDDFEDGWGNYTPGGEDAYLDTVYPYEGLHCAAIQDDSQSSYFEMTLDIDTTPYTHLQVDFTFKMISMDPGEDWWLQYFNGITWETVATFSRDTYSNGVYYTESVIIDGETYDMVSNAKIRFLCDATGDADDTYIDAITITGIDGSANQAPTFDTDPINEIDATEGVAYSTTIADNADDPDGDP